VSESTGFFRAHDQTELYYRAWQKGAKHACVVLHGYGDHSGRYRGLIDDLSGLPYDFYAYDHRGQGRSKGTRVHAESFDDFVKDCDAFHAFIPLIASGSYRKTVLIGHSLGGLVAIGAVQYDRTKWQAIVLSSPCLEIYGVASAGIVQWATRALNNFFPRLVLPNLVEPRFLTHDEKEVAAHRQDPLIERKITVHLACEIMNACKTTRAEACELAIPVLVIASGHDRIVSLDATKRWYERLTCQSKTLKVYEEYYHELFLEKERAKPIQEVEKFLIQQLGD